MTQGNAIFSLLRLLGSSIFIAITLVIYFRTAAQASVNLSSLIDAFNPLNLTAWISLLGQPSDMPLRLRLVNEVRLQAAMIGYVNAFHLLTLAAAVAAPLAFLFATRQSAEPQ